MKDEGVIKHDYSRRSAIDIRTCYCIKDEYLSKHDTSTHYVGLDEFDVDAATADLPTQEQQTALQTNKSDRVINAVWISYVAKWTEFAPHDDSIKSAYTWYNHATNANLARVYVKILANRRSSWNSSYDTAVNAPISGAQISSIKRVTAAWIDDTNEDEYILKGPPKKRRCPSNLPGQRLATRE